METLESLWTFNLLQRACGSRSLYSLHQGRLLRLGLITARKPEFPINVANTCACWLFEDSAVGMLLSILSHCHEMGPPFSHFSMFCSGLAGWYHDDTIPLLSQRWRLFKRLSRVWEGNFMCSNTNLIYIGLMISTASTNSVWGSLANNLFSLIWQLSQQRLLQVFFQRVFSALADCLSSSSYFLARYISSCLCVHGGHSSLDGPWVNTTQRQMLLSPLLLNISCFRLS